MSKDKDKPPGQSGEDLRGEEATLPQAAGISGSGEAGEDAPLDDTLPSAGDSSGADTVRAVDPSEALPFEHTMRGDDQSSGASGPQASDQPFGTGPPKGPTAEELLDSALSESSSGRFKLRKEIGRGGIGRVLLAFDPKLGREVAIKELLPGPASGESKGGSDSDSRRVRSPAERRFLDEARITAQLEHPGIVPVHELGEKSDGRIYYAMRLVRGKTLTKAIAGKPLAGRLAVLPQFTELCHAIAYAHSRGVVHRDLKPDNVMLGEFGETLVVDWGLAKVRGKPDHRMATLVEEMDRLREDVGGETVVGVALGTPAYMPPEQAAGDLDQIDAQSDVYSLGAILYEILCGRPPHKGKSVVEVLTKVCDGDIVNPLLREPEVAPELADICLRALANKREDRYTSAKQLAADVRRFQVGQLVHAHTYGITELVWRWICGHRAALAVITTMLILALGGWWYRGWSDRQARAEQERARRARVTTQVEKILADVAKGTRQKNWLDIYSFKLISLKEPLVEQRLIRSLAHANANVRRLSARALGGMKSNRAVWPLCDRLRKGVEPSQTVVIAVINALGIIGDSRANRIVSQTRYRYGQQKFVWNNTALAFSLIPLPRLPNYALTAAKLTARCMDLSNKGDLKGGIVLCTRAIARNPKYRPAYLNRAIFRRQAGDRKGALADYTQAIALAPDEILGYYNRGLLLRLMRNFEGALADLDKVVRSGRRPVLALVARAKLHHVMGRLDLSIRDYRAAIALQPNRAVSIYSLAYVWRDHGRLDKAFETLNQALRIHPRFNKALTVRAAIRQFRGDLAGALVDADKAVALDPDYGYGYTRRGQVLLAQGHSKAASADFDKAVALKSQRAWFWGARAIFMHYKLGQYDKARADLRQALKIAQQKGRKKKHQYRVLLIAANLRAGRVAQARALLREAVVSHPNSMEWAGIRFLSGELTASALAQQTRRTVYWLDYVRFLQGLTAELAGDPAAARTAYSAVMTRYRWSNLWYAVAAHHLRLLQPAPPGKPTPKKRP